MIHDYCKSYSFSLKTKLCQDIRYYKKTTQGNNLNSATENFLLNFINRKINYNTEPTVRGRPFENKKTKSFERHYSFQFPLKISTIKKIKLYKKLGNDPSLDSNLEEHLRLIVPVRNIQ